MRPLRLVQDKSIKTQDKKFKRKSTKNDLWRGASEGGWVKEVYIFLPIFNPYRDLGKMVGISFSINI